MSNKKKPARKVKGARVKAVKAWAVVRNNSLVTDLDGRANIYHDRRAAEDDMLDIELDGKRIRVVNILVPLPPNRRAK